MSYITAGSFKKNSHYLVFFLSLSLVGCVNGRSILRPVPTAPVPISALGQYENEQTEVTRKAGYPVEVQAVKSPTAWVVMDPPLRSPRVTFSHSVTGEDVNKAWAQLKNKEILNLLSNTRSEISVGKFDANGELTYLVANTTGGVGSYKVIMDYTPYIIEDAIDPDTNKKIGDARVGLGLRLTANINTNTAGINLGSLMALGLAAKTNQLQGSMHVDTIGIRLNNNSGMILSSTTIDETSILKALEALAVIQSKIADADTHLDPQVIWVKPISRQYKPDKVAEQMSNKAPEQTINKPKRK